MSKYIAAAQTYAQRVAAGDIPSCKWTRLAVERQMADLEREPSLARYDETVPRVQALVAAIRPWADRLIYVPGNHDHHIWLLASELAEVVAPSGDYRKVLQELQDFASAYRESLELQEVFASPAVA